MSEWINEEEGKEKRNTNHLLFLIIHTNATPILRPGSNPPPSSLVHWAWDYRPRGPLYSSYFNTFLDCLLHRVGQDYASCSSLVPTTPSTQDSAVAGTLWVPVPPNTRKEGSKDSRAKRNGEKDGKKEMGFGGKEKPCFVQSSLC